MNACKAETFLATSIQYNAAVDLNFPVCFMLLQCNKVAVMKDGAMVYFGPYDANALNIHMPVDHLMHATVEGKESAAGTAPKKKEEEHKVLCSILYGGKHSPRHSVVLDLHFKYCLLFGGIINL